MFWKGIVLVILTVFRWLFANWAVIPKGFTAVMILIILFTNVYMAIKTGDWTGALEHIAQTLFSAELVIKNMTDLAISQSPEYGFFEFLQILNSFFIVYFIIKYIGLFLVKVTGSQAEWMAYIVGAAFVGIIEIVVIKTMNDQWFIPIWDGMIYGLRNLDAIFGNIYFIPWEWFKIWFFSFEDKSPVILNITVENITSNVTDTNMIDNLSQIGLPNGT